MCSVGWSSAPATTRAQIDSLLSDLQQVIGSNLLGLYLHGSLAMGYFNPARSDLDLLAVIEVGMAVETKRMVAVLLLDRSRTPYPIEISFLCRRDLAPWLFPTPYDLHYREAWRVRFQADVTGDAWRSWNEHDPRDPDLAAHITILRCRGITLFGPPIVDVFPPVPAWDFLASILGDFAEARDAIAEHPVYGVLKLCRVYWYVLEGRISSKAEAGAWAAATLPRELRSVVMRAFESYGGAGTEGDFASAELMAFTRWMDEQVRALVINSSTHFER